MEELQKQFENSIKINKIDNLDGWTVQSDQEDDLSDISDDFEEIQQIEQDPPKKQNKKNSKNKQQFKKRIKFNIQDSSHAKPLFEKVIMANTDHWMESINEYKVKLTWAMAPDSDIYQELKQGKIINRYPNTKDLCRKDIFGKLMQICANLDSELYSFVPPSFIIPQDAEKFLAYQKKNKNTVFIAKPESGAQGDGIFLFKELKDLQYKANNFIIQKYIDKPLLLDGQIQLNFNRKQLIIMM